MQRLIATLLIALVGAMAFVPQALCPCARRARAEAAASGTPASALPACCERCLARAAARAGALARAPDLAGRTPEPPDGDAPRSCPCCEMNGKGKNLLQPGEIVRAPELASAGFVFDLAVATTVPHLVRTSPGAVDDVPDEAPPAVTRAGVVLLI
jgi:hypothetical protein